MREYEVEINGYTTTLQLSDEDAKARGLTADEPAPAAKESPAPLNKARAARAK